MELIKQRIAEIVGEASMLWSETPSSTFNSEKAKELVDEIMTHIQYPILNKETDKCYLEYVEGYLTCTFNHKIGEECLMNKYN